MHAYVHHVSGFFARHQEAEDAVSRLVERGIPRDQLTIFEADANLLSAPPPTASDTVLKDVLVNSAIGTAVGTGAGALAEVALAVASVSLFIASPLVAPLVMMGWGASLGMFIGAGIGAFHDGKKKEGPLSDLIGDAITQNQVVLVATTRSEKETATAQDVIRESVGVYQAELAS
jgi:hypothetical protein